MGTAPWADQAPPSGHGQTAPYAGRQYAPQRDYAQPDYAQPDYAQPDYAQQDYAQPDYGQQRDRQGQEDRGRPDHGDPQAPLAPAVAPHRSRRGYKAPDTAAAGGLDTEVTDDPMEAFSERWHRRGADTPRETGGRRRLYIITGGVALVAIAAIAALFVNFTSGKPGNVRFNSLVTTFLPGEIQKVPDACKAVSQATLSQYLPGGQPAVAFPPLNGGADSQCTWTLDKAPTYRVIEVDINAFSPSGLASGNGSATFAASDAYVEDLQTMQKPAANSGQPAAIIADVPGLGTGIAAFSATQIFDRNGTITYKATVFARYHNVIVTAVVNGLDKATTSKGSYGPVSMDTLKAAAMETAREAVAQLPK